MFSIRRVLLVILPAYRIHCCPHFSIVGLYYRKWPCSFNI